LAASAATCCGPSPNPAARISRWSASTTSARSRPTPICCASTGAWPLPRHRDRRRRLDQRRQRQDQGHRDRDPAKLPQKELGVDIALECTGIFTAKDKAAAHLDRRRQARAGLGAGDGADKTIVFGVNHDKLTKDHLVVSNGSCTTNCLAPVAKVLNDTVGIEPAS
jgi:hypothetical protein